MTPYKNRREWEHIHVNGWWLRLGYPVFCPNNSTCVRPCFRTVLRFYGQSCHSLVNIELIMSKVKTDLYSVTIGLIACWTTLMAFSRAVGAYWALLMYCVACTMMQGIFCLGEKRCYHERYVDSF